MRDTMNSLHYNNLIDGLDFMRLYGYLNSVRCYEALVITSDYHVFRVAYSSYFRKKAVKKNSPPSSFSLEFMLLMSYSDLMLAADW